MIDTFLLCSFLVKSYVWMSVQSLLYFLVPSILIYRYWMSEKKYFIGLNVTCGLRDFVIYTILLIVSIPLVSFVSEITREVLSLSFFSDISSGAFLKDELLKKTYDKLLLETTFFQYIVNIVVLGIIPALSEEFFFRGIVQNFLRRHIENATVAVLFAAMIFSMVHFQASEFLSRTIFGFIIGYAYLKSGSIWVPVVMHAANNIIALALYPYSELESYITRWWIVLLSVVLLIILFSFVRRQNE